MPSVSDAVDHFSLKQFARALEGFRPPTDAFDPNGSWKSTYEMVECSAYGPRAGAVGRLGQVTLEREPAGRDRLRLRVDYRKRAAGGMLCLRTEIECRADVLATPISWKLETETLDNEGQVIPDTRLAETGRAGRGKLEVRIGKRRREVAVGEPFTMHWGLFDAVQRLPREKTPEHRFTLVDRLDYQVKPSQVLAYRKSATLLLGSKAVWGEEREPLEVGVRYRPVARREGGVETALTAYEHFGEGILPTVYWVDGSGRLLFVVSGLVGYLYKPEVK